jgi:hypothetical protein
MDQGVERVARRHALTEARRSQAGEAAYPRTTTQHPMPSLSHTPRGPATALRAATRDTAMPTPNPGHSSRAAAIAAPSAPSAINCAVTEYSPLTIAKHTSSCLSTPGIGVARERRASRSRQYVTYDVGELG